MFVEMAFLISHSSLVTFCVCDGQFCKQYINFKMKFVNQNY